MSLWHKPIEAITYEDVEAFCQLGHAEGPRLDYKAGIPGELQKLVAAFANTLGGLIILGIEADKTTNKPTWPPKGMLKRTGIEEQITAICCDNIYPPVRPQISPVLDNPHAPGTVLVVMRVDESPEAPHAVKGLIYERTGSQGSPFDLSSIDRISYLLGRRGRIEEQRLELVLKEIQRAARQLAATRLQLGEEAGLRQPLTEPPGPRGLPLRWASVIPMYPWRELCPPKDCFDALRFFDFSSNSTWQRVPGGALGKKRKHVGLRNNDMDIGICSLSSKGHVFAMECTTESLSYSKAGRLSVEAMGQEVPIDLFLTLTATREFAAGTFDAAVQFYRQPRVELPGYILLSVGLIGVLNAKMVSAWGSNYAGKPFVDEEFGTDVTVTIDQFLSDPTGVAGPLNEEIRHGFDI